MNSVDFATLGSAALGAVAALIIYQIVKLLQNQDIE